MQDTVLVTGFKLTNFTVKEKGEEDKTIDMMKVSYLTKNSGSNAIGSLPSQINFMDESKTEMVGKMIKVPGLYNVEYAMVPGKNNKPQLEIVDFEFVKEVDLKPLFKVS